jgi:hypothetical protein
MLYFRRTSKFMARRTTAATSRFRAIIGGLSLCVVTLVRANDTSVTTKLELSFERCIQPEGMKCVAFNSHQKDACRKCTSWTQVNIFKPIDVILSDAPYAGKREHASAFVKTVLTDIYDFTEPQAAPYVPPKMSLLYNNPERYGWVKLPFAVDGTIMVDRRKAALVVGGKVTGGPRDPGPRTVRRVLQSWRINVFHPSARNDGQLRESLAKYYFNNPRVDGEPIAIAPDIMLYGAPLRAEEGLDTGEIPFGWNSWLARTDGSRYEPLTSLQPNTTYNFFVHLAPFPYRDLYGVRTRQSVAERLGTLTKSRAKHVRFNILAVTDDAYLQPVGANNTGLDVDLDAIRRWQGAPFAPSGNPLDELRAGRDDSFVFGETIVQVRTGGREGPTAIGISIWDADGWPIDEFVTPVCVAASNARAQTLCKVRKPTNQSFGGADLSRATRDTPPDAALHLVDMGILGLTAIFRRNDITTAPYHVWKVHPSAGEFRDHVAEITTAFGDAGEDPEELSRHGERLYRALFGDENSDPARAAFEAFARPRMQVVPCGADAPSFYVRFIEGGSVRRARLLPLGAAKLPGDAEAFLGYYFRVETPLVRQVTEASEACLARWTLLLPTATHAHLGPARRRLNERVPQFLSGAKIHDTMRSFRKWIGANEDDDAVALMLLTHHDQRKGIGKIRLDANPSTRDYVASDEVRRQFLKPSAAVLLSCGSGAVGAEAFLNALNQRGVDAIVATRHDVSTAIAVDFLDCFAKNLPDRAGTPLATVHFDTVQCVRKRRSPTTAQPYGPAALAYTLAGDSSLQLCQPKQ